MLNALGTSATLALLTLSSLLGGGVVASTPLGQAALVMAVVAAIVSATLGGFLVAAVARASGEVTTPAASVGVIYAALGADLAARAGPQAGVAEIWAALSLAVVLMGVLMALAGWLRIAEAIKFMPAPVAAGFVTGVGVMLMWSQVGPLLGLEGRLSTYAVADLAARVKPLATVVAIGAAAVMMTCAKRAPRAQPALVALAAGTALHYLLAVFAGSERLGPTLGTIEPLEVARATFDAAWSTMQVSWLASTAVVVLPYAAFLALQATMNAAVTAVAVGNIMGIRPDVSRTLKAQGAADIVCGLLAGLPVTTAASVSLPAARMGAGSKVIAASFVVLLLAVLVAGELLSHIPVAVLAGILVVTGLGMIDRWGRGLAAGAWRERRLNREVGWNLAIVAAVAAAFCFGSVSLALVIGAILAMLLLAINMSSATLFLREAGTSFASTRVWPAEAAQWLATERRCIAIWKPRGALFFGTAEQLAAHLDNTEQDIRYCVIDLSRLTTVDATGCQILATSARKLGARGVTTLLAGVSGSSGRAQELAALGLSSPDRSKGWFPDLDHALEWIEGELVRTHWPEQPLDAPVDLAASPLGAGLDAAELATLHGYLTAMDVPPGPLFSRGEPGTSMFVIDRGFVEIRIGDAGPGQPTRLAAFGPGSIFGEVALLTSDRRTADAVCIEPTRLYELQRDTLVELEARSPALYARIVENLNRHLANRLVIATGIVQAHR